MSLSYGPRDFVSVSDKTSVRFEDLCRISGLSYIEQQYTIFGLFYN